MRAAIFPISLMAILSALATPCSLAQQVRVDGHGNVGIVQMTGGTVNMGLTADEARDLAKATAREQQAVLERIVARLNTKLMEDMKAQALSMGVVRTFLATVKGKDIPEAEWPAVFGELIRNFLILGERIQATPITSDVIKHLVDDADRARARGDLDTADTLLARAEAQALDDAYTKREQALQSSRQAASLLASRAQIAFLKLDHVGGAGLLVRAFEERRGDVASETIWWLFEAADAWTRAGSLASAQAVLELAYRAARGGSEHAPDESQWQRDQAISHSKIGDVQVAQGDLASALESFKAYMAIAQRLAQSDPRNTQWQRDLAVSAWKLGTFKAGMSVTERRDWLARGLSIVEDMAGRGALSPADAGMREQFRRALDELD